MPFFYSVKLCYIFLELVTFLSIEVKDNDIYSRGSWHISHVVVK